VNASDYLMLPWTISGPVPIQDEDGNKHYEMRIAELPDFMVAEETESKTLLAFKGALLAFLESYTSEGEVPPAPDGPPMWYGVPKRVLQAPIDVLKVAYQNTGNVSLTPELMAPA
jgi:hypothetical protein